VVRFVEEIPGGQAQGETQEESRGIRRDGLVLVLEANRELTEQENQATTQEEMLAASSAPTWKSIFTRTVANLTAKAGGTRFGGIQTIGRPQPFPGIGK